MSTPQAEEGRDEERDDHGNEADHEQVHRTTQHAMAMWWPQRGTRGHHAGLPLCRWRPRIPI
jgi:hypothetical protein